MTTSPAALEFGCPFVVAYVGRCNQLIGPTGFCRQHAAERCRSCGDQAVTQCSFTGQFVCGAPLCARCEGWNDPAKPSGSWGFVNHTHRRIPGMDPPRVAVPGDFGFCQEVKP